MSEELERAYASNEATPLLTLEFIHPALEGGALRLVRSYNDITATLESGFTVTFLAAPALNVTLPENSTEGTQDLSIRLDNVSNQVWSQISAIATANRASQTDIKCNCRPYLLSDLSAPAGGTYSLTVKSTAINRVTAIVNATYLPIPNTAYPRLRYYSTKYPGVKYQ